MYMTARGAQLQVSAAGSNWMPSHKAGTINGTARNDVFYAVSGDRMLGGLGDDQYSLYHQNYAITESAGQGTDTVFSYIYGQTKLADNVENLFLLGPETNHAIGNALSNIIVAGTAGAYIDGGAADDVLVGGTGRDTFQVRAGQGSEAIERFAPGSDLIRLEGYSIADFAELKAMGRQVGGDVRFDLADGEALVLRDVSLTALRAVDFRLVDNAATALDPQGGTGLTRLVGPGKAYSAGGWHVLNNVWNPGGLAYGRDYKVDSAFSKTDVTGSTTFNWSFPTVALAPGTSGTVRAYPEVIFGASPHAGGLNVKDMAAVFPVQLDDLTSLKADYDVSFRGDTGGYNVSFDIWLTSKPNGNASTITNEVMIWVHQGSFEAFGERIGTYVDGDFAATIYHEPNSHYTAIVANRDVPAGSVDVVKVMARLEELGIVSKDEYLASIELGAEVVSGAGSLTINDFEMEVASRDGHGNIVTKTVTGSGTTTTVTPEVPVEPGIHGTTGADLLTGTDADDLLYGRGGDDRLDGGAGVNRLDGGAGDDAYVVRSLDDNVVETAGNGTDRVLSAIDYTLGDHVEQLTLTGSAAIAGTGNALANRLVGNAAANALTGLAGDDVLDGGAGADRLDGGLGDDVYHVDDAGDRVIEGKDQGDDTIYASVDYDLAGRYIETLVLTGTAAIDATGNTQANTLRGNDAANILLGLQNHDSLYGGGGNDTLDGGTGDDTLDGGTGDDRMIGGIGNDVYHVDSAADTVVELRSQGIDTVYASADFAITGQFVENLTLTGTAAIDALGNSLDNVVTGNAAANDLDGSNGDDRLHGLGGDDTLRGGSGIDQLEGGDGADLFVFKPGDTGKTIDLADRILDFSHAQGDRIDLSAFDANTRVKGDQAFTFFAAPPTTATAGALWATADGDDWKLSGDTNGDGIADLVIRIHTSTPLALLGADFSL